MTCKDDPGRLLEQSTGGVAVSDVWQSTKQRNCKGEPMESQQFSPADYSPDPTYYTPDDDFEDEDDNMQWQVVYSTRAGNESGLLQVNSPDPNHPLSQSPTGFSWLQSPRHGALSTHSLSREPRSSTSSSPSAYGIWGCGHSGTRNRSTSLRLHT